MRIAAAQINTVIGDFAGNREKILFYTKKALSEKTDFIIFPELSLCGYPPLDLLDQELFYEKNEESLRWLQRNIPGEIAVAVGHVAKNESHSGKSYYNSVSVIMNSRIIFSQAKTLLPSYDVFDESRYFEPASCRGVFELCGKKIGIAICEDLWWNTSVGREQRYCINPVRELVDMGAEIIAAPSASPFFAGKRKTRKSLIGEISRNSLAPVIYVNSAGGNDSLVFDGNSMITDSSGSLVLTGRGFE